MSLLVVDFTHLEGPDRGLVVKELAAVDSHIIKVSSYVFKRPYSWEEVPLLAALKNQAIDHGCNWNDGYVRYSDLQTALHREASYAVGNYCFGLQETQIRATLLSVQLSISLR